MTNIEWLLVVGLLNVVLLGFGLFVFMPRQVLKTGFSELMQRFRIQLMYLLIIFGIVAFHLIEVHFIDPVVTNWLGIDYAGRLQGIEGDTVAWFAQHWLPGLLHFFVIMYIVVYPFTLWFSPLYFLVMKEQKAMQTLAYGLLLIYVFALPFYLFMPVTNVYTYFGLDSALTTVIPTIEQFFYSTTTVNNCFPSLHVAMTLLIARAVSLTENKKFMYFTYFCAGSVIIGVMYLAIHWILDVISGIIIAVITIVLLNRYILRG